VDSFTTIYAFLSGAIALGYGMAALLFHRFWRRTRIRLFHLFAIAFLFLAGERVVEVLAAQKEAAPQLFLLRLVGFVLIIAAIINHNRKRAS
jgi:hypothetical protein